MYLDDLEMLDYLWVKVKEVFEGMLFELKKVFNLEENIYEVWVWLIFMFWFKKLVFYDFVLVWVEICCLVFVINGDKDLQVVVDENFFGI